MENLIKNYPDMLQSLVEVTVSYAETQLRAGADTTVAANNVSNMFYIIRRAFDVSLDNT